jgi:hypothetical protein
MECKLQALIIHFLPNGEYVQNVLGLYDAILRGNHSKWKGRETKVKQIDSHMEGKSRWEQ